MQRRDGKGRGRSKESRVGEDPNCKIKMAKHGMLFAAGVLMLVGLAAAAHAPTACRCENTEFSQCVFAQAEPGVCQVFPCAGATCSPTGEHLCMSAPAPGYVIVPGGCELTEVISTSPLWSDTLISVVDEVSASDPVTVGNSNADFKFWINNGTIYFSGTFFIEQNTTPECQENTITVAHIHEQAEGSTTGPARWFLCGEPGVPCPTTNMGIWEEGVSNAPPANEDSDVAGLLANPSEYYVNIHTTCAPAGLIRGQMQMEM
ncbi:hypothetical protein FVE85_1414 [Porphyridium purpureum]|uniref:CHRD domain-containing protein n=1 Tax=Porphyridium purpureum TaxID=35688 RepID=A0A5J4YUT2_PORPP|nr:hypothetical protein FVE85_1414 [Porphyridium purpureum]|eukprot:POR1940..scf209_3